MRLAGGLWSIGRGPLDVARRGVSSRRTTLPWRWLAATRAKRRFLLSTVSGALAKVETVRAWSLPEFTEIMEKAGYVT